MPLCNFIALNDFNGGGMSSPSTNILNFFRISSYCLSGTARAKRGGLQLKTHSIAYTRKTKTNKSYLVLMGSLY